MARERQVWGGQAETREHRGTEEVRKEIASSAAHAELLTDAQRATAADRERVAAARAKYDVTPFDQLPKLRPLIELQAAFQNAIRGDELEASLIRARRYLAGVRSEADKRRTTDTVAALEEQQRDHLARQGKAAEKAPPPKPESGFGPEIDAALSVLFEDAPTPLRPQQRDTERLTILAERRIVFDDAVRALDQLIEQLRSEASAEIHQRLSGAHATLLLELYRASQQFARTAAVEREFRSTVTGAGYLPRPDLSTPPLVLGASLVLGSETDWSSQIAEFRRHLERRGLV